MSKNCPDCKGSGTIYGPGETKSCSTCDGMGKLFLAEMISHKEERLGTYEMVGEDPKVDEKGVLDLVEEFKRLGVSEKKLMRFLILCAVEVGRDLTELEYFLRDIKNECKLEVEIPSDLWSLREIHEGKEHNVCAHEIEDRCKHPDLGPFPSEDGLGQEGIEMKCHQQNCPWEERHKDDSWWKNHPGKWEKPQVVEQEGNDILDDIADVY